SRCVNSSCYRGQLIHSSQCGHYKWNRRGDAEHGEYHNSQSRYRHDGPVPQTAAAIMRITIFAFDGHWWCENTVAEIAPPNNIVVHKCWYREFKLAFSVCGVSL